MPGIKKKWIKASHKDEKNENDKVQSQGSEDIGDEDRDPKEFVEGSREAMSASPPAQVVKPPKPRSSSPKTGLLKGLGEVLQEKRKRFVPSAELKLNEWLESNIEKKEDVTISLTHLYNYYTELCQGQSWDVLDVPEFNKVVKNTYGKAFGLTEASVLKGLVKERKLSQVKKKPSHGIKLKDVVIEAIHHYGNPSQGVRFFNLKQFVGTKYPVLRVDMKPKMLKRALEMGVQFGYFTLVKGIGMAGFYRLPGDEDPSLKEEKEAKKEKKDSKTDSTEAKKKDGEPEEDGAAKDGEKESEENSSEAKEPKEEAATDEKKKQPKQPKKYKPVTYSELSFSNPDKMEDIFPVAITYQSAPKVVGLGKIRKYIAAKYNEELTDNRYRQVIEKGVQNNWWEHVSGSGISGSLHLLMDDFDPGSSQTEDQICAAIIACHEPKSASANQIKKYVSQYHPEFKVDERPKLFKKALIRAVEKNMIVQLSGLGANGSFQLTAPFVPSPSVLAGDDASDSEEEESEEEIVYVPRGTKSRGKPKAKAAAKAPAAAPASSKGKGRGRPAKRKSYAEDSSDEEYEEVPSKKTKKGAAAAGGKRGRGRPSTASKASKKRDLSPLTGEDNEEQEVEYTPRKSKSRGGGAVSARSGSKGKQSHGKAASASKKKETPAKASPSKASSKSPKNGKKSSAPSTPKKETPTKRKLEEESDADDEEDFAAEYTPRKSRSRGGGDTPTPAKKVKGKGSKK